MGKHELDDLELLNRPRGPGLHAGRWRMSVALALGYLAVGGGLCAAGIIFLLGNPETRYLVPASVDVLGGLCSALTAVRASIVLTADELIVTNTVRVKRIHRRQVIEASDSRFGVLIYYAERDRPRSITSPCGMGIAGIRIFGRKPRAERVADELNEGLGVRAQS